MGRVPLAHAAPARRAKLTLAGPFALVSYPLMRIADSGALADVADKVEVTTWTTADGVSLDTDTITPWLEQIAALKALGYANAAIAGHYLKLVSVIVVLGLALGVALGNWLGTMLTGLYAEFFFFPVFEHRIAPWLWRISE